MKTLPMRALHFSPSQAPDQGLHGALINMFHVSRDFLSSLPVNYGSTVLLQLMSIVWDLEGN